MTRRKSLTVIELMIVVAIGAILVSIVFGGRSTPAPETAPAAAPAAPEPPAETAEAAALRVKLTPAGPWRDGLAAVVLVDVSGSMHDRVRDASGARRRKIEMAQRAAIDLVEAFDEVRARASGVAGAGRRVRVQPAQPARQRRGQSCGRGRRTRKRRGSPSTR